MNRQWTTDYRIDKVKVCIVMMGFVGSMGIKSYAMYICDTIT